MVRAIEAAVPDGAAAVIDQDTYYRDLTHLSIEERKRISFDHPDSIDTELFAEHLDVRIRRLFDIRIFVEVADDVRFIRRLLRDVTERGRSVEGVIEQYLATVRPMHLEFVEPSKRHALAHVQRELRLRAEAQEG